MNIMLNVDVVSCALMLFVQYLFYGFVAYFAFMALVVTVYIAMKAYDRIRYYTGAYFRYTKRPFWTLNRRDGSKCEYATYNKLRKLEKQGYRFMFELYVPKTYGGTTEIDMLAIGPQGVIVVECKDYSGMILGEEDVDTWIQDKRYGSDLNDRYRKFYNPIMQNDGHIRHLREYVPAPTWLLSMIAFDNHSKLDLGVMTRKDVVVLNTRNAMYGVQKLTNRITSAPLTNEEIKVLENKLRQFARVSAKVKRQHIADVQRIAATNGR